MNYWNKYRLVIFQCIILSLASCSILPKENNTEERYAINTHDGILLLRPFFFDYYKIKEQNIIRNFQSYGKGVIGIHQFSGGRMDGSVFANVLLNIMPTIHFANEETRLLFKERKWGESKELGIVNKIHARALAIFQNGIRIDVNLDNDKTDDVAPFYFIIKDGFYFQVLEEQYMGDLLEYYDFKQGHLYAPNGLRDRTDILLYDVQKLDKGKKYEQTLVQFIQYFKPLENELWLISPYGSYILYYDSYYLKLVDQNIFAGNEFYYYDKTRGNSLGYGPIDLDSITPPNQSIQVYTSNDGLPVP
jgi:hypothetical protein